MEYDDEHVEESFLPSTTSMSSPTIQRLDETHSNSPRRSLERADERYDCLSTIQTEVQDPCKLISTQSLRPRPENETHHSRTARNSL